MTYTEKVFMMTKEIPNCSNTNSRPWLSIIIPIYNADKNALKIIFHIVNRNDCSVVQFGFLKKYKHLVKRHKLVKDTIKRNKEEFYDLEYPKLLCSHWCDSCLTLGVWNKVYYHKLSDKLPDPTTTERIFWGDDLIINLHLLNGCESMCFVSEVLYCYR